MINKIKFATISATIALSISTIHAQSLTDTLTSNVAVDGMVCSFCAVSMDKALRKIEGVVDVDVDLDNKNIQIIMKDGMELPVEKIQEVVKDSGFKYNGVK